MKSSKAEKKLGPLKKIIVDQPKHGEVLSSSRT